MRETVENGGYVNRDSGNSGDSVVNVTTVQVFVDHEKKVKGFFSISDARNVEIYKGNEF